MNRRKAFSPTWVDRLGPEARAVEWTDTKQPGLVLRVEVKGRKTWVCRYVFNGAPRRFVIGTFPEKTLKDARDEAANIRGSASGRNPIDAQADRQRDRVAGSVAQAVESWLADAKHGPVGKWKGGLTGGTARSFMPHVRALVREHGSAPFDGLNPAMVEAFVSGPKAPATRNRRLTALRLLVKWATRKGLITSDPTALLGKEEEEERDRVLSDDELRALIHGFDGTRYGRAVRLLALTGLRRDEVLGAEWKWLDADAGVLTIPKSREKAGKKRKGPERRVALSPQALAVLAEQREEQLADGSRCAFVFATTAGKRPHADALKPQLYRLKGKRANGQPVSTDKRAKPRPAVLPEDVTLHDVRRTVGQRLADAGVMADTIYHGVLGHIRPKIKRGYVPTRPLDDARAALMAWGQLLDQILTAESAIR